MYPRHTKKDEEEEKDENCHNNNNKNNNSIIGNSKKKRKGHWKLHNLLIMEYFDSIKNQQTKYMHIHMFTVTIREHKAERRD